MAARPAALTATDSARTAAETAGLGYRRANRWLARIAWALTLMAASSTFRTLRGASSLEVVEGIGAVVGLAAVATIGALVVTRRPAQTQGWLLLAFAFFWSVGVFAYHFLALPGVSTDIAAVRLAIGVGDVALVLALNTLLLLFLVVPTGRPPSSRWNALLWAIGGSTLLWSALSAAIALQVVDVDAWLSRSTLASNAGAEIGQELRAAVALAQVGGVAVIAAVAAAVAVRLRSSRGEQRQQVKWIALGATSILFWLALSLPESGTGFLLALQPLLPGMAFVSLALGFGFALFKYRLWDVDQVARRSLTYGILWLLIAGIYGSVAVGLGVAAGTTFPVEIAVGLTVGATLLFQPARTWLESAADTLVYGRRDSPIAAIRSLGVAAGVSDRPHDVGAELADVARRAVRLAWIEVEIDGATVAMAGTPHGDAATIIPVALGEERFGTLRCQPDQGDQLTPGDVDVLGALAGQAALAISHARLASRIVRAQEQERRRIERNIHDGAQQDLAALIARLGLARARSTGDQATIDLLNEIQGDVHRILSDLRELAQGIHPSVLRDGGLRVAVEDRCSRLPIEVALRISPSLTGTRLPPEVEAAAYFLVAEGLANALKHSDAGSVDVTLALERDRLAVEVADAGGGASPAEIRSGSGISGLADRLQALGGTLIVESRPGAGTRVRATMPARPDARTTP